MEAAAWDSFVRGLGGNRGRGHVGEGSLAGIRAVASLLDTSLAGGRIKSALTVIFFVAFGITIFKIVIHHLPTTNRLSETLEGVWGGEGADG